MNPFLLNLRNRLSFKCNLEVFLDLLKNQNLYKMLKMFLVLNFVNLNIKKN